MRRSACPAGAASHTAAAPARDKPERQRGRYQRTAAGFRLRVATVADLDACCRLFDAPWSRECFFGSKQSTEYVREWLASGLQTPGPTDRCWVACTRRQPRTIGFCAVWGGLLCYAVDPAYRGRGLASQLVMAICNALCAAGLYKNVDAVAFEDNAASHAVLLKCGFEFQRRSLVRIQGKTVPVPLLHFARPPLPPVPSG